MSIFVYADESGVFDHLHNDYFVFGGILLYSKNQRDIMGRKYLKAERNLGNNARRSKNGELKAATLSNAHKGKLFRSLNQVCKFAVVVRQQSILESIFSHPKSKQRYLDYAFKIGLKHAIVTQISEGVIPPDYSEVIDVRMDEHTTATDGRYELREALEAEYRIGTYNTKWDKFYPPILPLLSGVNFCLRDSARDPLIRAADIVANRVFHYATMDKLPELRSKIIIKELP